MYFFLVLFLLLAVVAFMIYLFYPRQLFPLGIKIDIQTPNYEKYHNDCLHPCIRYISEGFNGAKWWMVQSPYYNRDNKLENPILYYSTDTGAPIHWQYSCVVRDTPSFGYNSDPCIFYDEGKLWVFWRECDTPLCLENGASKATVGCYTTDGVRFSEVLIYLVHKGDDDDTEQCPILIKRNNRYYFYSVHYQYKPDRKFLELLVWEGSSLLVPDFERNDKCKITSVYSCDKWKQIRIDQRLYFIPKPLKHDLWHFDLIEFEDKLLIITVSEWGDSVMIGLSTDFINFRLKKTPLINTHCLESVSGFRQYLYKPTGYVKDNKLHLFYTVTSKNQVNQNELWYSELNLDRFFNRL
jgi:hypothetical protein